MLPRSSFVSIRPDLAKIEEGAAGVPVVVLHGVGDLPDAQVVLGQRLRVHLDLVLANETPEVGDVGHAGNLEQPRCDHPVLQLAELQSVDSTR